MKDYKLIRNVILTSPWAILPEKLDQILAFISAKSAGVPSAEREFRGRSGGNMQALGSIAVIGLFGTIAQRLDVMVNFSGGTSTQAFARSFREALADASVKAIILETDSPGGTVYGVAELSSEIHAARGKKPVIAAVNSLAASAAYWIASAADEIVVTPGGEVGSIGVYATHIDESKFDENIGVKVTLISAGRFKVEANPFEPLADPARSAIQKRVNEYYDMFVNDVGRNRKVPVAQVRNGFGEGRVVGAQEAVRLGMADRVGTIEQAIARAASGAITGKKAAAQDWEHDLRRRRLELHGAETDEDLARRQMRYKRLRLEVS